jgi:hypothetical protein
VSEAIRNLLTVRIIFSVSITFFFAYAAYEARNYMYLARVFPLYLSLMMLFLSGINLVQDIITTLKKRDFAGAGLADLETKWDIPIREVWSRFGFYFGVLLLLYLCIFLVGFVISMVVFVSAFYRLIARSGWPAALIAGAAAFVFLPVAAKILMVDWPAGVIGEWINLPVFLR